MSTPQYAGIDYAGHSSTTNRNTETGIRYGVISQNSVSPYALDDIVTHGTDVAWELALKDAIREAHTAVSDDSEVDDNEIADQLAMNWESNFSDYEYKRDGYHITGCLDSDLMVMDSPFYTYAQFCSPCVPGAGSLDNPFEPHPNQMSADEVIIMAESHGFPKTYCLGHDWFDDGKAPYPVFSVKDNSLVQPTN